MSFPVLHPDTNMSIQHRLPFLCSQHVCLSSCVHLFKLLYRFDHVFSDHLFTLRPVWLLFFLFALSSLLPASGIISLITAGLPSCLKEKMANWELIGSIGTLVASVSHKLRVYRSARIHWPHNALAPAWLRRVRGLAIISAPLKPPLFVH